MIRALHPTADLAAVVALQAEVAGYWLLADGRFDAQQKAAAFFEDCPPGCDGAQSHRLGLFHQGRLSGLAEVSFGFPAPGDAYLGLMILAPRARGMGLGRGFLHHVQGLARGAGAPGLYLAVLQANPGGRMFWQREGFSDTGLSRHDPATGHTLHRLFKPL